MDRFAKVPSARMRIEFLNERQTRILAPFLQGTPDGVTIRGRDLDPGESAQVEYEGKPQSGWKVWLENPDDPHPEGTYTDLIFPSDGSDLRIRIREYSCQIEGTFSAVRETSSIVPMAISPTRDGDPKKGGGAIG
ncbi:MAG: hypothetical protein ACOZNI_07890 [Myxococcota bacterium]